MHGAPGIRAAHWRRCRALEARTGFLVQQHVEEELSLPGMDAWTGDLAGQWLRGSLWGCIVYRLYGCILYVLYGRIQHKARWDDAPALYGCMACIEL